MMFLLVTVSQYGVYSYCVLCRVKAKKANKSLTTTKNFVVFHSPLLTMTDHLPVVQDPSP